MRTFLNLAALAGGVVASASASADMITNLTPAMINGGSTLTASFSDGNVSLTPFVGVTPVTFNGNATRLGIDNNPAGTTYATTNANAFNDGDLLPNNGNEERLVMQFATNYGLQAISYDFSRADGVFTGVAPNQVLASNGPDDGVIISGFTKDPNVTFSVSNVNLFAVYDGAGSVRLHIPGTLFGGTLTTIQFDPAASFGQTLNLKVTDTDTVGAQLAIRGISYAVPEPSTGLLALLGMAVALRGRRYHN